MKIHNFKIPLIERLTFRLPSTSLKTVLPKRDDQFGRLRPQALDGNDLAGALSNLVEKMRSNASSVIHYQVEGISYSFALEIETNVLRIAQEALGNALKHAQAQTHFRAVKV